MKADLLYQRCTGFDPYYTCNYFSQICINHKQNEKICNLFSLNAFLHLSFDLIICGYFLCF